MDKQRKTSNLINIIDYDENDNVILGEHGISLGFVDFDNTPTNTPTTAGSMYWNDTDGTTDLILKGGNVTLQVGQEQVLRVVNKTATNINLLEANYQAVRVTGAQGQRLKVDLALATSDLLSAETIGLVTETIDNNQEGFITTSGLVRGINTTGSIQGETWVDGDVLYLSPTVAGRITKVKPVAPNHLVIIGYVIHAHITQGSIFVKVDNGYELDELHNVKITTPLNDQSLVYNSTLQVWENKTVSSIPTLQEVTDEGNVTTNSIKVADLQLYNTATEDYTKLRVEDTSIFFEDLNNPNKSFVFDVTYLTALRGYFLSNESGNLPVMSEKIASFTANLSVFYSTKNTITVTDPTLGGGEDNKGYIVHVIGGTSTIGGVGYTAGALVYRFYNGSSWVSTDMNNAITIDATPTDGSTNAVSSNGVFDALVLKQNVLTNPVTGTGVNGQVSFWNGANSQSGDNGLFWDNTNKRLGVGTTTPANPIQVGVTPAASLQDSTATFLSTNQNSSNAFVLIAASNINDQDRAVFAGRRSRGTLASPTAVLSGDSITTFLSGAFDGTSIQFSATLSFDAESNASAGNAPQQINLVTGTTGANRTRKLQVRSNGNVIIQNGGTFTDAGFRLDVNGTARVQGITTITPATLTGATATSALDITQTWNTTGSPTAINVDVTNTASGGSSRLLHLKANGGLVFDVRAGGNVNMGPGGVLNVPNYAVFGIGLFTPQINAFNGTNTTLTVQNRNFSIAGTNVRLGSGIISSTSGNFYNFAVLPTYNQTSGSSSNTDIFLNRTTTAVGSGVQRLMDLQHNSSSVFSVSPTGSVIINSTTEGFLPPRMTNAQRLAIASPAVGLIVYCTDAIEGLYVNTSTGWKSLTMV